MKFNSLLLLSSALAALAAVPAQAEDEEENNCPPVACTYQPPSLYTAWEELAMDEKKCVETAKTALRATEFTGGLGVKKNSVHGSKGDFKGAVECISAKSMVHFTVSGQSDSSELLEKLKTTFMSKAK
jgi:hypothetical protein